MNMGLFTKILEKLGLKKDKTAETAGTASGGHKPAPATGPAKPPAPTSTAKPAPGSTARPAPVSTQRPAPTTVPAKPGQPPAAPTPAPAPAPVAISEVDVVKKLEGLAAAQPLKLNWRTSISDLLFLLGIDNSYEARKELAVELGCPPELMKDSAKMNTWLHKKVLQEIAANGGNIPKELLD
jgi:hypothetical protein